MAGRFAANVGFLFTEHPYLDRFEAARREGFSVVEMAWPTDDPTTVARAISDAGVEVALVNMPAGDLHAGDRGFTNDPALREEWRRSFELAIDFASDLGCPIINVLAGRSLPGVPRARQIQTVQAHLAWAADRARRAGHSVVIEMLNAIDTPGYLLTSLDDSLGVVAGIADPALGLQFDTYHVALMEGDLLAAARRALPWVRHVQIADLPDRREPGSGRLPIEPFLRLLEDAGYDGDVGLEYVPTSGTRSSLSWLQRRSATWPSM